MSNHLIKRFLVAFGEPKAGPVEVVAGEYVRVCRGVPGDVIEAATSRLIDSQTYRTWPTVAEVAAAIRQAASNPNRGRAFPPALEDFGTWWQDKLDRARLHRSDDDLRRVFHEVEPYAASDMIHRWRWDELALAAKHNRQTLARISIETPHNVRNKPHIGRPSWLDPDRVPAKTEDSRQRVAAMAEEVRASGIGLRRMEAPDPQDYRSPTEWAGEVPYKPAMQAMQANSRNRHLHRVAGVEGEPNA